MRVLNADRAETILFLHGGNVAGWMWGEQVPAFGDYRLLVPDLPGFGESNGLPWESVAATADHVAALLDRPVHVVGLSLGSSVALELAARHPELVLSLFLASTQAAPTPLPQRALARVMLSAWERRPFWAGLARSYGLAGADAELFVSTGLGIRRATAVAVFDEVRHGIPDARLALVQAPTLAVAGERDSRAVTVHSLERLARGIRGCRTAIAPGMHHQWNIEGVELFNDALRTWLHSARVGFQADNHHSPVHPTLKEIPPWH